MEEQLLIEWLGVHKLSVKTGWETKLNFKDNDNGNTVISGSHKNADGDYSVPGYGAVSTGI
jgi:hypothetical protein